MINLREIKQSDSAYIVEQLNKKEVIQYLTSRIPYPYTESDAEEWINKSSKEKITKIIECDKSIAGTIGVTQGEFEFKYSGEIGYWLGEQFWGRGIATQALKEMTDYVFSQTEIIRLTAHVFEHNKASMQVLQKNGYQLEAVHKKSAYKHDQFYDMHLYVKTNS